jgi:hypothetical protein
MIYGATKFANRIVVQEDAAGFSPGQIQLSFVIVTILDQTAAS